MPTARAPEFRRRTLDLVAQGNPLGQFAKALGIGESGLRRWMSTGLLLVSLTRVVSLRRLLEWCCW